MIEKDSLWLSRRDVLYAALLGSGSTAMVGCALTDESTDEPLPEVDVWVGIDERITQRTLAEAEKLFGLQFTKAERRQMLGGPVELSQNGFFATTFRCLMIRSMTSASSMSAMMRIEAPQFKHSSGSNYD